YVQRHINLDGTDPHGATSVAMAEVSSAVVATSLVLISVFVPVSFFPGTTGILYRQFSLTIAFSIAISLFNALTLSPALAAILLRNEEHKYSVFDWTGIGWLSRGYRKFAHGVDGVIHGLGSAYGKVIGWVLNYRYAMIVLFLTGLAATAYMYVHVPTGFVPQEDHNYFIVVVQVEPPAINGIGSFGGFQFELQDLGRNTLQDIDTVAHKIVAGSRLRQDLTGLFTSFTANDPQQLVQIDREKAKAIGVPISQVTQALGVYMGSQYVNDFDFNNRSYRVYLQDDQPFRMTARDMREYYVRSDTSGLVPLGK